MAVLWGALKPRYLKHGESHAPKINQIGRDFESIAKSWQVSDHRVS